MPFRSGCASSQPCSVMRVSSGDHAPGPRLTVGVGKGTSMRLLPLVFMIAVVTLVPSGAGAANSTWRPLCDSRGQQLTPKSVSCRSSDPLALAANMVSSPDLPPAWLKTIRPDRLTGGGEEGD